MNATPTHLTPARAGQASPQAGKEATSPDVPFSQVLSSEIAQSRKSDAARENDDTGAEAGSDAQAASPAAGKTDAAQRAKAGEDATQAPRTAAPDELAAVAPEALLGLPISPDALKTAPATVGTQGAATEAASAPGAPAVPVLAAPTERAIAIPQAGQRAVDARAAQQADLARPGRQALHTATAEDRAAATPMATDPALPFADRLAAALRGESAKPGEIPAELTDNPALRAAAHAPLAAQRSPADPASPRLAPTVGTAAWGQALGEKLVWMAAGSQQTASITLNPPNLGPLQIVLHVTNDQATASFFSAQPEVRHALESAFPRLREMMNDAGIQLGQASVSADTPQQNDAHDRQAQRLAPAFPGTGLAASGDLPAAHVPEPRAGRGLVDTFA